MFKCVSDKVGQASSHGLTVRMSKQGNGTNAVQANEIT